MFVDGEVFVETLHLVAFLLFTLDHCDATGHVGVTHGALVVWLSHCNYLEFQWRMILHQYWPPVEGLLSL